MHLTRFVPLLALLQCVAAELTHMTEVQASAGVSTLSVGPVAFGHGYTDVITRGFNGGIPGPTFRMSPGEPPRFIVLQA